MKILIAADIFPPQTGGPATYTVAIARALTQSGDKVKVVSLNPDSDESRVPCIMHHVSSRNKLVRYLQYFWLLFKHSKDTDVIFAMGPVNAGFPAWFTSFLRRKKYIVKIVGDYAWEQGMQRFGTVQDINTFQNKNVRHSFPVYVLRWIQSFVVRHADRVIVPSEYLKKIVVGWGAEDKNVKVIYNAVEFKKVELMKKPDSEKWIVSVGRLVSWKGMGTLIEIMPDLLGKFPGLKLKIVGDGPVFEDLRFKIEDLRLRDTVELIGELPREKTLSYIATADVFVLNSGYEGLSHVILEALNAGVPVLASRVGGNPELVSDKNLFEYKNKEELAERIKDVLQNESVSEEEVELSQFEFDNMIKRTFELLQSI